MAKADTTFRITLKHQKYEFDIEKINGRERIEAKRLLETPTFKLSQLWEDEVGIYVLAYLAAKKTDPTLTFEAVTELTGDEVTIEFPGFWDDGDAEPADPFGPSEPKGSAAKQRSSKSSAAATSTSGTSGTQT